jgi:hypothetical protein
MHYLSRKPPICDNILPQQLTCRENAFSVARTLDSLIFRGTCTCPSIHVCGKIGWFSKSLLWRNVSHHLQKLRYFSGWLLNMSGFSTSVHMSQRKVNQDVQLYMWHGLRKFWPFCSLYCHMFRWLRRGFGLVNRFIGFSLVATTNNCNTFKITVIITHARRVSIHFSCKHSALVSQLPSALLDSPHWLSLKQIFVI